MHRVLGKPLVTIERTTNMPLIRKILTDERVFGKMADDFAPPREQYEPLEHPEMIYLAVNGKQGIFALIPHSRIMYEIHTCLHPELWGAQALEAAASLLAWVWANTICERLITSVPQHNRTALRFAQKAGLEIYGTNPRAFMKNGRLENIVMLGISRPIQERACDVRPCVA